MTTDLTTYHDRPILKEPVWIWTVPAYFYVGGVAGAALLLGAAAQLSGDDELRPLIRASRWMGLVGYTSGTVLLIADLGRPERFMHMLRTVNWKSPLSIGSWVLAVGGALNGAAVMLPRGLADVAALGAGAMGIPLAGYTGVVLGSTAIPVWQGSRRTLPALFMASAVASCASLFELMDLTAREAKVVQRFGVMGKVAEIACMSAIEGELAKMDEVAKPLHSGLSGALWTASKVLTVTSLALTLLPGTSRKTKVAGVAGTLAGVGLRFAVFYAGFSSSRNPKATV